MFGKIELRKVKHFDELELKDIDKDRLKLLIDTKKKEIHHVLSDKHHVDEALIYLGIKEKDLKNKKPSHLVSVQVIIKDKIVKEVYIGGGSLELVYQKQTGKNLHKMEELKKAEEILNKVLNLSEQLHEVTLVEDISKHEHLIPS